MTAWNNDEAAAATAVEDVDTSPAQLENTTTPADPQLYYGSVAQFVQEFLCMVYRRRIDGRHRVWAARWWEYDEAVVRLEALWRAWEHLRMDAATGISLWLRDHADYHMAILFDPDGPFATAADSDENRNKRGEPLPCATPPPGLFPNIHNQT